MNKYINCLTNWTLFSAGIINIVIGTIAAYQANSNIAMICLVAGLVFLFAATIDRFESLKGLGIEAKTRQLDKKLNEAEEVLDQLKKMTEFTGKTLVNIQTKIGRWSTGPTTEELIEFGNEIRKIMRTTGSDDTTIQNVLIPWAEILCLDISYKKLSNLREAINERISEITKQLNAFPSPITLPNETYEQLIENKRILHEFITTNINNLDVISLEEYPEKIIEIYNNVPLLPSQEIERLKQDFKEFIDEIRTLKTEKKLLININGYML